MKNFADIARPLHRLTDKGAKFEWTTECEEAFQNLKEALISSPILSYPKPALPFILDTDASHYAVGAVLSQAEDGVEHVIAYMSKALNKHETSYCVTRKELLAVVIALKTFHSYLYGQHVLLRTDNAAVSWMRNLRNPTGQVARWLELLGTYDLEVTHRPGYKHRNADALSRSPCKPCMRQERSQEEDQDADGEQTPDAETVTTVTIPSRAVTRSGQGNTKQPFKNQMEVIDGWDSESIRAKQLSDKNIGPILSAKENSQDARLPWNAVSHGGANLKTLWSQWDRLTVVGGILYRKWYPEDGDCADNLQLIVPDTMKADLLKYMHDIPSAGHLGVDKTLEKVKKAFYWPRMKSDVHSYCQECDHCAARKASPARNRAPLCQYLVGEPFERIEIDVFGPLPKSKSGNKYILTMCDCFTKWIEAVPLSDQEANTITRAFVDTFICRYGTPLQLHSDRGTNFESNVFKNMCNFFQIDKTRTTSMRPQSNGNVERFHRTLAAMLTMYCEKNQSEWDIYLPQVMMAYRSSRQASTLQTPYKMLFGRELVMPLQAVTPRPASDDAPIDVSSYLENLKQNLAEIHSNVRGTLKKSSLHQKRNYDLHAKKRALPVGQLVWAHEPVRRVGICSKLTSPWKGPYVVVRRLDDLHYLVKKSRIQGPKVYHVDKLQVYRGRNVPKWTEQYTNSNE